LNERRRWTDLVGTMSVELMKPFSLTYVRYPGDDPLGAAMALASLMPFCVIVATFGAFFARRELWDVGTLLGILANEVLAQTLKRVFQQPRPASCALVDFCGTHGMPSSHAQLAWFVAAVAVLAYRRRRDAHPASTRVVDAFGALLVAAHVPMAIAVTASRVYLGYHSAEQVAAGPPGSLPAVAGRLLGMRDSSLVANPEEVARKHLAAQTAAPAGTRERKSARAR
jgi:dolichyldiphosphatase